MIGSTHSGIPVLYQLKDLYSICRCFWKFVKYSSVQIVPLRFSTKITHLLMIRQGLFLFNWNLKVFSSVNKLMWEPQEKYCISNGFSQKHCHNWQLMFLRDGNWKIKLLLWNYKSRYRYNCCVHGPPQSFLISSWS